MTNIILLNESIYHLMKNMKLKYWKLFQRNVLMDQNWVSWWLGDEKVTIAYTHAGPNQLR